MIKIDYRELMFDALLHLKFGFMDWVSQLWGSFLGLYIFMFGEPTHALFAVGILMLFDLITKIRLIAKKEGGYWKATRNNKISPKILFQGTMSKITAYFIVLSMAYMTQYIIAIESAYTAIQSVIFAVIYLREVQSVLRNMIEAEPEGERRNFLRFIKLKFNEKAKKIEDVLDNELVNHEKIKETEPIIKKEDQKKKNKGDEIC